MTSEPHVGPTWWPAAVAFGITITLLGVVTEWLITLAGLAILLLASAGWAREMLHD